MQLARITVVGMVALQLPLGDEPTDRVAATVPDKKTVI